ncbi:hypothetical protein FGO68_gene6285 [Halteria grandinella]|uniref:FCP1 homology domain-containing protein n=1 Tax=Halteria grandinella TaxID=5974 RepID=A0A8J8P0R8_HALGN|nr:hypothetical protein FGO68_gene6285 [Halteria grandinella]
MCHSSVQSQDYLMKLKAFNTVKEDDEEDEANQGDEPNHRKRKEHLITPEDSKNLCAGTAVGERQGAKPRKYFEIQGARGVLGVSPLNDSRSRSPLIEDDNVDISKSDGQGGDKFQHVSEENDDEDEDQSQFGRSIPRGNFTIVSDVRRPVVTHSNVHQAASCLIPQFSVAGIPIMKSTDMINKYLPSQLGTDDKSIAYHLKKQSVLEFTNIKELKYSALFTLERLLQPFNQTSAVVTDLRRGVSPDHHFGVPTIKQSSSSNSFITLNNLGVACAASTQKRDDSKGYRPRKQRGQNEQSDPEVIHVGSAERFMHNQQRNGVLGSRGEDCSPNNNQSDAFLSPKHRQNHVPLMYPHALHNYTHTMGGIPKHLLQVRNGESGFLDLKSSGPGPAFSNKHLDQRFSHMESGLSQQTINLDREKLRFSKTSKHKKTIIFDFDETLAKVHFKKKELDYYDDQVDILTKDKQISIFISLRPGLKQVLRKLKEHFELILFTSSSKIYCDGILRNVIEADEKFFDHKLFKNHLYPPRIFSVASRFHKENTLIKNLDILLSGRNIQDLVIVDNRAANYCDHLLNGIPITDYNGEKDDVGLFKLEEYLMNRIVSIEDVRVAIKEDFIEAVLVPQQFNVQINHTVPNMAGAAQSTLGGPPAPPQMPILIKVANPQYLQLPHAQNLHDASISVADHPHPQTQE